MAYDDEPLGYEEVEPLLDALRSPAPAVRSRALRTLVRLPLGEAAWVEVAMKIWPELYSEPVIPRSEFIAAAARVPVVDIRRELHDLVRTGDEETRRTTAYALAGVGDGEAIPQLLADLSGPDPYLSSEAAEALSLLDVTPVWDEVQRLCRELEDGNARLFLALYLARLGSTEGLKRLLQDLDGERVEINLLWGDPAVLKASVAARGPFPQAIHGFLSQFSGDEGRSEAGRFIAAAMLEVTEEELTGVEEGLGTGDAPARQAADPELSQQASELAAAYLAKSPFVDGFWGWEEGQLLAHLPHDVATELVTALFTQVVEFFPPGQRLEGGNGVVISLPRDLWHPDVPDIPALSTLYRDLDPVEDGPFAEQLAWAISRAGLRRVLAELLPALATADEAGQIEILDLLEKVIAYLKDSEAPIFGAGGAVDSAGGIPAIEPYIEIPREEAAVGPRPVRPLTGPEAEPEPEPRWLQGQILELGETGEVRLERALRAGALHRLRIQIGPPDAEWFSAPAEAPIPIHLLPVESEYAFRVVFSEPNHVPEPLTDMIYLPRHGTSNPCEFQFRTRQDVGEFKGRVVVWYRGRILQTMALVAQVLPDPGQAPPDLAIRLVPDTPVRANLADLDSREPFDAMIVADTSGDEGLYVTEIRGERVEFRSLESADKAIKNIRRRLGRVARTPDQFPAGDLYAEATENLLRFLARQGSLLYGAIVRQQIGASPLTTDGRIQLVSARHSFLPLEFLYDRPAPVGQVSKLCPHAREALAEGVCHRCDGLEEQEQKKLICPLGFWCMNKVLERHAVRPVAESGLGGAEYALQRDPVGERTALDLLDGAVFAASNRVREADSEELFQSLTAATEKGAARVQDWEAWRVAVDEHHPSMLLLLPHTLEDEDLIPALEIGDEQILPETDITLEHIHARHGGQPVTVLLLGCETAVPDMPFQDFAAQFRDQGAAIVLTTLTPVLGRHAAPVAQILVDELRRVAHAGLTFGHALLGLRRRALAEGLPMVLSLVAYGDADWRLHYEPDATRLEGGLVVDGPDEW
jgi:hypothetical protein